MRFRLFAALKLALSRVAGEGELLLARFGVRCSLISVSDLENSSEERTFIGLGANLGDRVENLRHAVSMLHGTDGIRVVCLSTIIETAAVGGPEKSPPFLNAAAEIQTALSPMLLLTRLLEIEREMGRVRRDRWEPRLIDLDLLLYGGQVLNGTGLIVPHPLLHERYFVLKPLAEIAPEVIHPTLGKSIRALLDEWAGRP